VEDVVGSGVEEDVVDVSGGGVELDVVMGTEDDYHIELSAKCSRQCFHSKQQQWHEARSKNTTSYANSNTGHQ